MILVETKAESTVSSALNIGSTKEEKPTLSFSELLHGVKNSKDEKGIQNGSLVLALQEETTKEESLKESIKLKDSKIIPKDIIPKDIAEKNLNSKQSSQEQESKISLKDSLSSLLKNEDTKSIELNPKITQSMSVAELKVLIVEAKQFLKKQIFESIEYKKSELKELPRTLKGLTQVAKKFGIDIAKISIEDVKSIHTPTTTTLKTKDIAKQDFSAKESKSSSQTSVEEVFEHNTKIDKTKASKSLKAETSQELVQEKNLKKEETKEQAREIVRNDDRRVDTLKEIKTTPLFKVQEKLHHTTEQLVQTKQIKVEEKTPKTRADETLKLLLRGEKSSKVNDSLGLTKDFSVATARVIAPEAKSEMTKSIEQLLHGDVSDDVTKTDALLTSKADSFEVKLSEAKQMVKYLSQDVKNAIENYKSPFTRVKVQLNPQKMGEIDLTVVQRGKNLHVNLSSNNAAINTLVMNANDLKVQLTNNGIQNATLNFNDNSQNSQQNSSQQREHQNNHQADEEYNYFENEEQNEELVNSLEIVVPHYA